MKRILLWLSLLLLFLAMLLRPALVFSGAAEGLLLWFHTVVPTLFPFLVITALLQRTGAIDVVSGLLSPVLSPLFGTSRPASFAVLGGFLCGYPMGAKLTADLMRRGEIMPREGGYLLSFCNNASPMFVLSYLALQKLDRPELGLPSLAILLLAAALCSLLFRRLWLPDPMTPTKDTSARMRMRSRRGHGAASAAARRTISGTRTASSIPSGASLDKRAQAAIFTAAQGARVPTSTSVAAQGARVPVSTSAAALGKRVPASTSAAALGERVPTVSFAAALDESVTESCGAITRIGGYLIAFSILTALLERLPIRSPLWSWVLLPSLEMTGGIDRLSGSALPFCVRYPLIMGLTAFGGLCALFQTQSMLQGQPVRLLPYAIEKLAAAAAASLLSVLYVNLM